MLMNMMPLIKGLLTYLPGVPNFLSKTGGTASARYCYSVWLRHLVLAEKSGMTIPPLSVAELGPGDSLGTGIAALLSGANKYFALDIIKLANVKRNVRMLAELIGFFDRREMIPDEVEFSEIKPHLESYEFPRHILSDDILRRSLDRTRLELIRNGLEDLRGGSEDMEISYCAPWYREDVVRTDSTDLVISQAALEHIEDLEHTYKCINRWLKTGGMMSHQIDFRAHGTAAEWNGHWKYSDGIWKRVKGRRPYPINRQPYHTHCDMMRKCGFEIIAEVLERRHSQIRRTELAKEFREMPQEDLTISGAFVQAIKKVDV